MHYDGITAFLQSLETQFLEAMNDELGHKLSVEVFHPMCNLTNHLENLEYEIRNTKQIIENRLDEARDLVKRAQSINPWGKTWIVVLTIWIARSNFLSVWFRRLACPLK